MYPLSYLLGINRFKNGAWFEPSHDDRIGLMLQLLDITSRDNAVDIGSGDGRVVMAMAKLGAHVTGFEKDPQLVSESNRVILQAGLQHLASVKQADMWQQSYQSYNKVVIYQFKTVMKRLEIKLLKELPHGAKVVSNYWRFPHWQPIKQIDNVYLYINE